MKKKISATLCGQSRKLYEGARRVARAKVRCPECGRRLHLWMRWHDGGQEHVVDGYYWPDHKTKPRYVALGQ